MAANRENKRGDVTGIDAKNDDVGTADEKTAESKGYTVELIISHRGKAESRSYHVR